MRKESNYRNYNRKSLMIERGITLISLVITIIILKILSGVAINLSLGENEIFERAKEARDEYLSFAEEEQKDLNELYEQLGIENLPENTPETPQEIGKREALKDGWGQEIVIYTSTENGQEVTGFTKVAIVYAVSVGNGETVSKNFWYVGGTLDTGVIISDNEEDKYDGKTDKTVYDYTRRLKGNQFVWIPCNTWNGIKQTNITLGDSWWDTTIPKAELSQIEKYGGFYVARYEVGLASTILEFTETQTSTGSNKIYNKEGVPQSKAGIS